MRIGSYAYDTRGREIERATFPAGYHSATTRPPLSAATSVISTRWHATFNLPTQRAEPGRISAWSYSAKGLPTGSSWTATTDGTGAAKFSAGKTGSTYATGYSYTAAGLVSTVVERETPPGGTALETQRWTMAYNAAGDLTRITDVKSGAIARGTQYDAHGRLVTETDSLGSRNVTYAPTGLLRSEMFTSSSAVPSYSLTATHNSAGLITELNTGTGFIYRWAYDANHRVTALTLNGATLMASPSKGAHELPTRLAALLTLSRDAKAQATAPTPAPGGGLRGPGWIGSAGLIFQIGRNIMNQQQAAADSGSKDDECDPCHDPGKRPRWKMRGTKHTVPPNLDWTSVRASTSNGGSAKYKPELTRTYGAHQVHEESIWAAGKVIKNTRSSVWKVARRPFVVGAADGADTTCTAVLCSAGEIHGFPAPEADCDRPAVPYP